MRPLYSLVLYPLLASGALPLPFLLLSTELDQDSIKAEVRTGLLYLPLLDLVDPKLFLISKRSIKQACT